MVRSAIETIRNIALQAPVSIGPFTSLAIPGRSLETIVYLAVGVHGWWKTEETTKSLLSVIKMQHPDNEILSASSFELSVFENIEDEYPFHGATINDEENGARGLQSIQMDGPFTGPMTGSKAMLCLRALTSGLLCLFSRSQVFDILFDVLQTCLIHFHQPDIQFARHGPFSSALKDWIEAEKTKESFRHKSSDLMKQLDDAAIAVLNVSVEDLRKTQFFEEGLVIPFLQWLFVEEHRHDPAIAKDYPTRSFRVWSLAFILSKVGFRVEASTTPILDQSIWRDQVSQTSLMNCIWRVHLVTSNAVFADLTYDYHPSRRIDFQERRLIPIGTIPIIAFDYFRYYDCPDLDPTILHEVFHDAFNEIKEQLPQYPYLRSLADLQEISNQQEFHRENMVVRLEMTEYQKRKLEDWVEHPGFAQLLQKTVSKHVPEECPDHCGKVKCHYLVPFQDSDGNSEEARRFSVELRKDHKDMSPWIKMHVIMIAFAYSVACQFIIADDGQRAGPDTEVIWTPIKFFENRDDWESVRLVIPDGDLKTWVRTLSDALSFRLEPLDQIPTETWPQHKRLKKALFQMICGVRSEAKGPGSISNIQETIQEDTLGCCANGLSLISKALISPAVDASTLHLYYVRFGRILELPVNSSNLIEGCSPAKRPAHVSKYDLSFRPRIVDPVLRHEDNLLNNVRWDAEPDWSLDFTRVAICCRLNGLPCGVYSPWYLARKSCLSEADPERCPCKCSSLPGEQEISFPDNEHWIEIPLCDFYHAGAVFNPHHVWGNGISPGETRNIFVRAGKQAHNQLAALDMFVSRASNEADIIVRKVLCPCLLCASKFARKHPPHWKKMFRGRINSKKLLNFIVLST